MTTVVRTRTPLETLSMSQPTAKRRSARIRAYDEEDGDFRFTRGAKRTKIAPADAEPIPAPVTASRRGRKAPVPPKERDNEEAATVKNAKGRKMSFSTPAAEKVAPKNTKKRRSTRASTGKSDDAGPETQLLSADVGADDSIDVVGDSTPPETSRQAADSGKHSAIISLPFSDTPVINRDKELRKTGGKGSRRSSTGLRGRRASSLIDNGHSALPHREVDTSDLYKHISAEGLMEPRRMKQLLMWTGERCMGEKPSQSVSDNGAALYARSLKETLLKDFSQKAEFSDWFDRKESVVTKIIKKPNPRNVDLEENIGALEARVKLLQEELAQWKAISKAPPPLSPLLIQEPTELNASHIDSSLLDPEQAAIFSECTSSSASEIKRRASDKLKSSMLNLEFQVDQFADGIHKVEQYLDKVGCVADKMLLLSAVRLEERDRAIKESVGTRDMPLQEVLRSLSRILPEGTSRR